MSYIKKMEKRGYGASTRMMHFRVLKRGFEIANALDTTIQWTFGKRAPSELAVQSVPWEESKIAFSVDEMKAMIVVAKNGQLPPSYTALVALSTTYGLRRCEMADLAPDDLNLKTKKLRVYTRHGSRIKEHLIPDEIVNFLAEYQPIRSEFKLSQMFHDIEDACGLPKRYGTGWHAPRRGLVNALVDTGVDKLYIYSYMRWKLATSFGMLGTYFSVPDEKVDEAVLKVHPFLSLWKS